jgi:predicted RNA-binding protein with PUA-like domain
MTQYFVMKNEPSELSVDHLVRDGTGVWDGIRNYQARNLMRDMKVGDKAFFYHSSCAQPGIYGSMTIHKEHFPDPGALDKKNDYFDPKATAEKNPWVCVEVKLLEKFNTPLLLSTIRQLESELGPCRLTAKGNRLSVIPVTKEQYDVLDRAVKQINGEPQEQKLVTPSDVLVSKMAKRPSRARQEVTGKSVVKRPRR